MTFKTCLGSICALTSKVDFEARKPVFRAEQGAVVVRGQTAVFVHFAVETSSNTGAGNHPMFNIG